MKKILVAGGLGFLGKNLVRALIDQSDQIQITIVDNLHTGNTNNLDFINEKNNIKILNHDICEPLNLDVDLIYNLACPASPIHYQFDPIKTTKTSVIGSINLLELAKRNDCTIFQASTSEIYGDPLQHPQKESYWGNVNPTGIRSCYDEGKRCSESLFFDYHRQFDIKIKVARIFNTYGPHMRVDDGRVVSNFINQALTNQNITIYGDGSQTRSFCYVDDLIDGFLSFVNTNPSITGPFNLGNDKEFSMLEIAEKIIFLTGSNSKLIFKDLPSDDPKKRRPDISNAKKYLNWEPKISLELGLKDTINYFKKFISNENN